MSRHTSNTLGYMRGYFRLKRENAELDWLEYTLGILMEGGDC